MPAFRSGYTAVSGNTFMVRGELRDLGGHYDPALRQWWIPADRVDEAQAIIDRGASSRASPRAFPPRVDPAAAPARCRQGGPEAAGLDLGPSRRSRRYDCPDCGRRVQPGSRCIETGGTH